MSESSQHLLKETVFRLLGCNQDQNEMLNELVSVKNDKEYESLLSDITEFGYLPLLKTNSSHVTGQQHCSDDCVRKLIALTNSAEGKKFTTPQKDELNTVVSILKTIKSHRGFHLSSITQTLSVECPCHLEVWMTLHKHGIVPLQYYIELNQRNSDFVSSFTKQILDYGKGSDETEIISDILSELINIGFTTTEEKDKTRDSTKSSIAILESFITGVLGNILKNETRGADSAIGALCRLNVSISVQKSFFSHVFGVIMGYRPEMKVSKAIREQGQWVYGKISPGLLMLYKQVLLVLDVKEVIILIRQILDQHEVNWQLFLSFISVLTVVIEESQKHLLEFTDSLLHEGLEDCDIETTITGILITRQTCLQGQHIFMSYADWFQRTFSESSRSFASSRKSFTFLMKLLTDLAPYESADHLKVHILRPPFVPGKCRQILTDYIMLAKTRLQDLQEPLDVQAVGDGTDQNKTRDKFTEEICNTVEAFQTTGKIPTSIIEASIFRKPFYIGQFLPALLKPRPRPDYPDGKMKLIAALRKDDKIPQTMYHNYEKECKKETTKLLQGVFEVLDSDDDMDLSPLEQLDNSLQNLLTWVTTRQQIMEKPKHNLREFVSVIASRLEACLSADIPVNQIKQAPIEINIHDINLPGNYIQVIDLILKRIGEAMQKMFSSGNFEFVWLTKLMEALLPYWRFTETLFKRIFVLIVQQGCSLQHYHIDTLAAILVEVHMLKDQITPSVFSCMCHAGSTSGLKFIAHHLSIETGEQMSISLRFTCSCLKYVYSSHNDENRFDDAVCLMKKFIYLSKRLVPGCRHGYNASEPINGCSDINDLVMLMYHLEFIQKLSDKSKLSFHDWLNYELQIQVKDDLLNEFERYEYHLWNIHHFYMRKPDGGFDTYMEAASIMMKVLLKKENRCCTVTKESNPAGSTSVDKGAEFGLIQQLSNLTQLFKEADSQEEPLPWLSRQLMTSLQSLDTDISKQNVVLVFIRLMMSLPAYLLFSDTPRNLTLDSHHLDGSVYCINSIFVTYLSEGVVLPVSLTGYLAQGLLQATKPGHHKSVVDAIFKNCPGLTLSCVVHFQSTSPFLDVLMGDGRSETQRFFSKLRNGLDVSTENHWLSACYIFSQIINISHRESLMEIPKLDRFKDPLVYKQIIVKVMEMLFIQTTYLQRFEQIKNDGRIMNIHSALNRIVSETVEDGVIDHLLQGNVDGKTEQCINSHTIQLYPATVLRFLRDCQSDSIGQYLTTQGLNGLVKSYVNMCQLYEEEHAIKRSKVVLTEEISMTSKFLVGVIEQTPKNVIKSVNRDILMECGPLIYDAVLHQI